MPRPGKGTLHHALEAFKVARGTVEREQRTLEAFVASEGRDPRRESAVAAELRGKLAGLDVAKRIVETLCR